jgi:hypothetical protein
MGVIRWVDRIDPSVWDRASKRMEALGTDLLERRVAIAFLEEFGRTPSEDSVVSTLSDDDDPDPGLLNGLFEEAVTEESWDLDKSLEELKGVARFLPGGSAFLKIIDFKGLDVEPPQICGPTEYGLFGCCSSANLADCASVAQRFAAPSDVAAALREWSPGLVGQLLGRGALAKKALQTISSDYYSGHWQTLCRAVLVTTSRGHHLGLGLSG